jgi:hypothetical protein
MGVQAGFFSEGKRQFHNGGIDWDDNSTTTIRMTAVDVNDFGIAVSGATNATPIVITAASHGVSNDDRVLLINIGGNANANGVFRAKNVATNTFELTDELTGANIAGSGVYTSGGFLIKITTLDFINDIPAGARVATVELTSRTVGAEGQLDAADPTFTSVTGDPFEAFIIWKDTGTESTSPLILCLAHASGLPLTPSGTNITVTFDNGLLKIARE